MERVSLRSLPACPTLFTPLQLHARELLRFGVLSWVGWMREHTISLQRMIERHGAAVVVAGASLRYGARRLFHDGDTIDIATTSSVHRKGMLIEGLSRFSSLGQEFACMTVHFRPVEIGEHASAAARPGDLKPELQALFHAAEVRQAPYPRAVRKLLPGLLAGGTVIASGRRPFKLFRYAMDFADQWAFMETQAFASASREELVLAQGGRDERLLAGLAQPLAELHVDLAKPCFVFDDGVVDTQALWAGDRLSFVHRLLSERHGEEQLHATVIEQMSPTVH